MNKTNLILAAMTIFAIILSLITSVFWIFLIIIALVHGNFSMAMISALVLIVAAEPAAVGYVIHKAELEGRDSGE